MERELCVWGCGGIAILPKTKYGKSGRCTERCYDCPGYKKKISSKIPWNKGLTKETNASVKSYSEKLKGKTFGFVSKSTHTEETKSKISKSMMGNRNGNHRGDRQSFYNGIRMDSSWEVKTAEYLDRNEYDWVYNERGYVLSDGRYYYPDFFIYENDELAFLIEVKGYFRESNKEKFFLFKKDYPSIEIKLWDKPVLKELRII